MKRFIQLHSAQRCMPRAARLVASCAAPCVASPQRFRVPSSAMEGRGSNVFHESFTPTSMGGGKAPSSGPSTADAAELAKQEEELKRQQEFEAQMRAAFEATVSPVDRKMARWLVLSAGFVAGIVVVGGVTRLTESGLSIVKWKPLAGVVPPMTQEAWEEEFALYKQFPEFKQKPNMTLDEFKYIFFWEWFHRVLARSMGIVYGVPFAYFAATGALKGRPALRNRLLSAFALGGFQGALGWYMVKSGLDHGLTERKEKATVSPYRLAAHLTTAFLIYTVLVSTACLLRFPQFPKELLAQSRRFAMVSRVTGKTMFITAVSGAFVAGLDAGLFYNDNFPWMGDQSGMVFPRWEDISNKEPLWRNIFENPCAAQLWHRLMAGLTTCGVIAMNYEYWRLAALYGKTSTIVLALRGPLRGVNHALILQVCLGIASLLSYVAVPIAAFHQANSIALLTALARIISLFGAKRL